MKQEKVRARGMVALLGYPNAGKSTLLNCFAEKKIAATSHKPQTTRRELYFAVSNKEGNFIFIDTPGLFDPNVSRALYQRAWGAAHDADILLWISDSKSFPLQERKASAVVQKLKHWEKPIAIAINKIDIAKEEEVFAQTAEWQQALPRAEIFQISAKKKQGIDYLSKELIKSLPPPRDILLDPLDDFHQAAEMTREKILLLLHEEVPWRAEVQTKSIEQKKKVLHVQQEIVVPLERYRAIFIGKQGDKIKTIGAAARNAMELYFDKQVHLQLHVEVKKNEMAR